MSSKKKSVSYYSKFSTTTTQFDSFEFTESINL